MLRSNPVSRRGFKAIRLGILLMKSPHKTGFEEKAVKSFKLVMVSSILLTIALLLTTSIVVSRTLSSEYDFARKRLGIVEGNRVKYVQNEVKYISLDSIKINKDKVKHGDEVWLYFDYEGVLIGGESEKSLNYKAYILLVVMGINIVGIIVFCIKVKYSYGKPWYDWLKSINFN